MACGSTLEKPERPLHSQKTLVDDCCCDCFGKVDAQGSTFDYSHAATPRTSLLQPLGAILMKSRYLGKGSRFSCSHYVGSFHRTWRKDEAVSRQLLSGSLVSQRLYRNLNWRLVSAGKRARESLPENGQPRNAARHSARRVRLSATKPRLAFWTNGICATNATKTSRAGYVLVPPAHRPRSSICRSTPTKLTLHLQQERRGVGPWRNVAITCIASPLRSFCVSDSLISIRTR